MVSFEVFVWPALRRMLGAEPISRPTVRAVATAPMRSGKGKRQYVRAVLSVQDDRYVVEPVGGSGSHLMGAMAAANGLVVIDEDVTDVAAGSPVTVMMLERRTQ